MLLGELITLRQQQLPVKVVVFNNGALAFVELEMKAAGIVNFGTDLDEPRLRRGRARRSGCHGVRVERAGRARGRPARGASPTTARPWSTSSPPATSSRCRRSITARQIKRLHPLGDPQRPLRQRRPGRRAGHAPTCVSSKASRRGVGEPGDHGAAAAPHEKAPAAHWLPGLGCSVSRRACRAVSPSMGGRVGAARPPTRGPCTPQCRSGRAPRDSERMLMGRGPSW